ncbi:MAG: hypothetical protein V7L27_20660 [Nostoc sp.]
MALRKDTALTMTGSLPLGREPILGGSASIRHLQKLKMGYPEPL